MTSWVEDQRTSDTSFWSKLKDLLKGTSQNDDMMRDAETAAGMDQPQKLTVTPIAQHYHPDRNLIHEQIKSSRETNLTVAVEQVSIFLTSDGTVITFFQVCIQAIVELTIAIGQGGGEAHHAAPWVRCHDPSNF